MTGVYGFEVRGRVQRVGFRAATAAMGRHLGLRGWVRNQDDGSVEGAVWGDSNAALEKFRRFLAQGPPAARVDRVAWHPAPDGDDCEIDTLRPFEVRQDRR